MIEHNLKFYLKKYFGYSSFKEGQEEVIKALIDQKDAVAILPTGTGKSMCYQLTGKLLDGTVIIVSPLLSLIQDQVEQLRFQGERRVLALTSNLTYSEKITLYRICIHISTFIWLQKCFKIMKY